MAYLNLGGDKDSLFSYLRDFVAAFDGDAGKGLS